MTDLDAAHSPTDCEELLCELTEARQRVAAGRSLDDAVPDTDLPKAVTKTIAPDPAAGSAIGPGSDAL